MDKTLNSSDPRDVKKYCQPGKQEASGYFTKKGVNYKKRTRRGGEGTQIEAFLVRKSRR